MVPLLVVLVLIAIGYLVVRNLNAPAEGTVSQAPPENTAAVDTHPSPASYSGKYVSFTYPAHYSPAPSKLSGNFLETDLFYGTTNRSKQITVGIIRESLSDDSGAAYRRQHPELYKQTQAADGALIFSSTDGHERTAYLEHGGLVASIAASSSNLDDLTADSQTVIDSLRWK